VFLVDGNRPPTAGTVEAVEPTLLVGRGRLENLPIELEHEPLVLSGEILTPIPPRFFSRQTISQATLHWLSLAPEEGPTDGVDRLNKTLGKQDGTMA
jgi:hypothetical protein